MGEPIIKVMRGGEEQTLGKYMLIDYPKEDDNARLRVSISNLDAAEIMRALGCAVCMGAEALEVSPHAVGKLLMAQLEIQDSDGAESALN